MSRRKADPQSTRDAAALLPFASAALLLPPFILVFAAPVLVAGIPLIVIYVFGVWAAVIVGAWLLSRRHARASDDSAIAPGVETGEPGQH